MRRKKAIFIVLLPQSVDCTLRLCILCVFGYALSFVLPFPPPTSLKPVHYFSTVLTVVHFDGTPSISPQYVFQVQRAVIDQLYETDHCCSGNTACPNASLGSPVSGSSAESYLAFVYCLCKGLELYICKLS